MAKLNSPLLIAVITASTVTPTAFALSSSSASVIHEERQEQEEIAEVVVKREKKEEQSVRFVWPGVKIPTLIVASDIKQEYKKSDCLRSHYGDLNKWDQPTHVGNPVWNALYPQHINKGCLVVEHYKQTYDRNEKWRGGLRLIWSLAGDQKGIVTAFNINTNGKKLTLDSSIYIFERSFFNNFWTLSHSYENVLRHISDKKELYKYLPQPGNVMELPKGVGDYWGFDPNIEKICRGNKCSDVETKPISMSWSWTKDNSKSSLVTDWSTNYKNWFSELFSSWFQIQNVFKELKGTWKKVS